MKLLLSQYIAYESYESNNEVVTEVAVDATEAVVADAVAENVVEESYKKL